MRHAPENTLAGFAACLELGLGFELDVRRTRDGHLVCVHDADVRRTTDGKGAVSDLTLAELRRLDADSRFDAAFAGQRVPTLEEVFALARERGRAGLRIALDLKVEGVEADVVRLAARHGVLGRVVCIGRAITEPAVRRKLRRADPETPVAVLAPTAEAWPAALADRDADWVYVRFVPTAAQVGAAHRAGKRVFLAGPAVSGDEPANWRLARDRGVDALLTDFPLRCRQSWRGADAAPRPKGPP
jgi:glycerophosphoryl diester phosphodiesterase